MKKWIIGVAVAVFGAWMVWSNKTVGLTRLEMNCNGLPSEFDGFRTVHISDLHNAEFGKDNRRLIEKVRAAKPDIIAITGDLIDSRRTDIGSALSTARRLAEIAPCYYVTGNHESRIEEYPELRKGLEEAGITVLDGRCAEIERGEETVIIAGFDDPSSKADFASGKYAEIAESELCALDENLNGFSILLAHRPELIDVYAKHNVSIVLSGHAHGGQFRLPFVGGLYVPNQGIFPKYDSGVYNYGDTKMIVSRGVGNSAMPVRFNNRPEIILVELKKQ